MSYRECGDPVRAYAHEFREADMIAAIGGSRESASVITKSMPLPNNHWRLHWQNDDGVIEVWEGSRLAEATRFPYTGGYVITEEPW